MRRPHRQLDVEAPETPAQDRRELVTDAVDLDVDRVVALAAEACMADADHPVWSDERFLTWLAEEGHMRDPRERRLTDAERALRGRQLQLRVAARRLRLRRREGAPPLMHAEWPGLPRETREFAAARGATPLVNLGVAAGVGRELWDEPSDQWVVVPDELPSSHYIALKIVGDSMEPVMHTGDTVLVRVGGRIETDTVVIARHPDDGYVCKKVRRLRRAVIELESLKPGLPLITIPRRQELIVGTVVLVWCEHSGPSLIANT